MYHIENILPNTQQTCFVIRKCFSVQECTELLNENIKNAFVKAHTNYPTYYRNNDRLVLDNQDLATRLFEKIKKIIPEELTINSSIRSEKGSWQLWGLNDRLRFCKYTTGQYFHRHLDGIYYHSATIQSKLTFMIYLNGIEEFEGGRTLFFRTKDSTEIWADYLPQKGDLIIFDHTIWHEGEELQSGEKYVLRSDILYQKIDKQETIDNQAYQEGHLGYIWTLLKTNAYVISGGRDKIIKIWDEAGCCVQRLIGHTHSILCLAQMTNDIFISGSRDKNIKVWKKDTKGLYALQNSFEIHQATVLSLCQLNNNFFASSGADNLIKINDLTGKIHQILQGHTDWVWQITNFREHFLLSCSEDKTMCLWNWQTGELLQQITTSFPIHCLAIRDNLIVAGRLDGTILVFSIDKKLEISLAKAIETAHKGKINACTWLSLQCFATAGEDNLVKVWDITTGQCTYTYKHQNFAQALLPLSKNTLLSASYDGEIVFSTIN